MKPRVLANELDSLAPCLRKAQKLLFFSDFDGTLVPINNRPTACFLEPTVRLILSQLAEKDHTNAAIISGRELNDLRKRVNVSGISYAGNHGLEIEGPGFAFHEPQAVNMIKDLHELADRLERGLAGVPGAWVQDKGLSASVHFREVNPAQVPKLIQVVHDITTPSVEAKKIVLNSGRKVLEIRTAVNWHKGSAVSWLINKLSPKDNALLTIYFGDDNTDEDAFSVLPEGITVCVGKVHDTLAKYHVRDHLEVHAFMLYLLELRRSGSNGP